MASEYRSSPDIFSSTAAMLPDQLGSLFKKQQQVGEEQANIVEGAEKKFAEQKGQYGIDVAKAKAAAARGAAGSELGVYKKYEKELMAPAPTIQYTKDTKEGMMSLAALLPMAAAMMGGKGHASALGALQSMSGVLQGHEEGNQARVALEEKNFKEKLDAFNRHQGQIKEAFERSLQMAKLNASAAQAQLEVKLAELNAPLLAAQVKRDGVVSAATRNLAAFDKMTGVIETSLSKINQEKGDNYTVNGKQMFLTPSQAIQMSNSGADVVKMGTSSRGGIPLPEEQLEKNAQAVANYALDPRSLTPANRDKVISRAIELNPNFNQGDYGNRNMAYRHWQDPQYAGGKQLAAFSTVAQHLDSLQQLSDAMNNNDNRASNAIINFINKNLGHPEVTNFNTARQAVAAEVVRAITGTAGAMTDRQEAEAAFASYNSPEQITGAIDTVKKLIVGRLNTALSQFKSGTGRSEEEFNRLLPPEVQNIFKSPSTTESIPTPKTKAEFDSLPVGTIYIDPEDGKKYKK